LAASYPQFAAMLAGAMAPLIVLLVATATSKLAGFVPS
jgi:hypothetical protein